MKLFKNVKKSWKENKESMIFNIACLGLMNFTIISFLYMPQAQYPLNEKVIFVICLNIAMLLFSPLGNFATGLVMVIAEVADVFESDDKIEG